MAVERKPFTELLSAIVDNRGRSCPTAAEGTPLIATNCVGGAALYPNTKVDRFVSKETYTSWFRGHPEPDDILFVCKGSPGRTSLVPSPVDFCIAQDMVAVRADPDKVYPRYLFAALRSADVQQQIERLHVGSLIPHFKKGDFNRLEIPVPDPITQRRVGDLYYLLSLKMETSRRLVDTFLSLSRALYGRLIQDAEDFVPLSEIALVNPARSKRAGDGFVTYLQIGDVGDGVIEWPSPVLWATAPAAARLHASSGDVIWSRVRPNRRAHAILVGCPKDVVVTTGMVVLRAHNVHPAYLFAVTDARTFSDSLVALADGTTYPTVDVDAFTKVLVPDVKADDRDWFGRTTAPMWEMAGAALTEYATLRSARDELLPLLLSGELSLKAVAS